MCEALPELAGAVQSTELIEISGIAASRQNEGVLWAHNDSGGTASVYAIGPEGVHLAKYDITGAEAIDWEDMAIGPGPEEGVDYLYLADFGDNDAVREETTIYRVPEPEVSTTAATPVAAEASGVARLVFTYPDRPHDAEALLVDPVNGDIVIVTKELTSPPSLVFVAAGDITTDTPTVLVQAGEIDFRALGRRFQPRDDSPPLVLGLPDLPTAGDVSADGDLFVVRTYATVWVWDRAPGESLAEALQSTPCEAPSALEAQGEAIAFDADGHGYTTVSEGVTPDLHHFESQ